MDISLEDLVEQYDGKHFMEMTLKELQSEVGLRRLQVSQYQKNGDHTHIKALQKRINELEAKLDGFNGLITFAQSLRLNNEDRSVIFEVLKKQLKNQLHTNMPTPCKRYTYMVVHGMKKEEFFPYAFQFHGGHAEYVQIQMAMDLIFEVSKTAWREKDVPPPPPARTSVGRALEATAGAVSTVVKKSRKKNSKKWKSPKTIDDLTLKNVLRFIGEKGSNFNWDDRKEPYVYEELGTPQPSPIPDKRDKSNKRRSSEGDETGSDPGLPPAPGTSRKSKGKSPMKSTTL